jgi:hypothetical protein
VKEPLHVTRLRRRLTFANVTSCLALFIALGGTGYAATVAVNSVGKAQIRSNGVGKSEIAANAVGASEIATNAVRSSEIRRSAVGGSEIRADSVGAPEIRASAVGTAELADGGIAVADIAPAARADLVAERAIVTQTGTVTGTTTTAAHPSTGVYTVTFRRDVSACAYSATPAALPIAGATQSPPDGATVQVQSTGGAVVTVRTFAPGGNNAPVARDLPFHLLVACAA